jgi:hypothetical protein
MERLALDREENSTSAVKGAASSICENKDERGQGRRESKGKEKQTTSLFIHSHSLSSLVREIKVNQLRSGWILLMLKVFN